MKSIITVLLAALLLGACGRSETPANIGSDGVEDGLKANTEEKTFEQFLSGDAAVNANVKVNGIIIETADKSFTLAEDESSSAGRIIFIDDIRLGERTPLAANTSVTVYGSYAGKNEDGIPVIKGIFIDVQ